MDAPIRHDDDRRHSDIYVDDDQHTDGKLLDESLVQEIKRLLGTLSPRERAIVKLYYGIGGANPLTLEDIALKFDLTRERIRQLRDGAIKKLQHGDKSLLLKPYL